MRVVERQRKRNPYYQHFGKARYYSIKAAKAALKELGYEMSAVYRCPFCHYWHIGHTCTHPLILLDGRCNDCGKPCRQGWAERTEGARA